MRIASPAWLGLWASLLATSAAASAAQDHAVLERERDPARLEAAAIAVARSNDPAAIGDLAKRLGERSFLDWLDPPRASGPQVIRLGRVFRALAQHPSAASASLCIGLAPNPDFTAVPARLNFLLNALAAVRPTSEEAANIFRSTSRTDYLEVNGPLLAANASPNALKVLAELLADDSLDAARRVSVAHWGLLPNRTKPALVEMSARLLSGGSMSREVQVAVVESLYDYQPRRWFGVTSGQPKRPSWSSAPPRTKDLLRSLATKLLSRPDLTPELRSAIQQTLEQL
ncbi:MAG TPA: hypothetical protein VGQ67_06870 [Candidatus Polarisedimenticolia bacterium]|nr:hypothetical protein [Candidatus Polarisedimenticolia bacterium]